MVRGCWGGVSFVFHIHLSGNGRVTGTVCCFDNSEQSKKKKEKEIRKEKIVNISILVGQIIKSVGGAGGGTKAGIISAHATIALHTASANGSATGCFGSENKDSPPHPTPPPAPPSLQILGQNS